MPHPDITLREVEDADLENFFAHLQEPEAVFMAAFTHEDPADRGDFDTHWARIRGLDSVIIRTVLYQGKVAGHVAGFLRGEDPEVTYWIGRGFWGKGLATAALAEFLGVWIRRPVYARVATDNRGSIRVLEKCGFQVHARERGFAHGRGVEVDESVMILR
jgi:RimJ/RimL family protein N-acetyltransferase